MGIKNVIKNNYKFKLVLIAVLMVFISVMVTYGAFYTVQSQNTQNAINTGCLSTKFTEGSSINLANALPLSDDEGQQSSPYSFSVKNTCTLGIKYYVILSTKSTSFSNSLIRLSLNNGSASTLSSMTANTLFTVDSGYSNSYILTTGTISSDETASYDLRLWLQESTTYDQVSGQSWEGEVKVVSLVNEEENVPITSNDTLAALGLTAKTGTPDFTKTSPGWDGTYTDTQFSGSQSSRSMSFYASRYYTYASSYTFNKSTGTYTLVNPQVGQYSSIYSSLSGKYIVSNSGSDSSSTASYTNLSEIYQVQSSTTSSKLYYKESTKTANLTDESETGIWSMADDYGTSYYFRGNVTNNYVNFAGFYWRIIRINGDGSIRMIYDGTQAYANGTSSSSRYVTESAFNENFDDNAYVGYMYGSTSGSTYAEVHANTSSSTIKTYLEDTWYKTNIEDKGYSKYLSDEIFCNDRSIISGTGVGTTTTYYGARNRLYTNKTPQLTCSQKNDAFTVDDTTKGNGALKYPVGLITADEIVLAGGKYYASDGSSNNNKYYLYKGSYYWSLSPNGFNEGYMNAYVFDVHGTGGLNSDGVNFTCGVAPVINLSAEYSQQLRGSGTSSAPFTLATGQ